MKWNVRWNAFGAVQRTGRSRLERSSTRWPSWSVTAGGNGAAIKRRGPSGLAAGRSGLGVGAGRDRFAMLGVYGSSEKSLDGIAERAVLLRTMEESMITAFLGPRGTFSED